MDNTSIGVANPYALAEIILGRSVNWSAGDSQGLLERTLGSPYKELFDPKFGSVIHTGFVEKDGQWTRQNAAERVDTVAQIADKLRVGGGLLSPLDAAVAVQRTVFQDILTRPINPQTITWNPPNTIWDDPGSFFDDGTDFAEPQQGGLGDCWLVAALSAVASARPYVIVERSRRTGPGPHDVLDSIGIYNAAGGAATQFEVSQRVPLTPMHSYMFCRSTEAGEMWPAVYEKAFAKWRSQNATDQPDYRALNGGWPLDATVNLTGLKPTQWATTTMSGDEIWETVRANSLQYRTSNPMTAWTYASGDVAPDHVDYGAASIVANHAYTILGWDYMNGTKYIVLRNPWGSTEATIDVLSGNWNAYQSVLSLWRSVPLAKSGVFAIKADTFKRYWAGFGVAK